jgi:hypothetical protein
MLCTLFEEHITIRDEIPDFLQSDAKTPDKKLPTFRSSCLPLSSWFIGTEVSSWIHKALST